jgi:hypothetical protein
MIWKIVSVPKKTLLFPSMYLQGDIYDIDLILGAGRSGYGQLRIRNEFEIKLKPEKSQSTIYKSLLYFVVFSGMKCEFICRIRNNLKSQIRIRKKSFRSHTTLNSWSRKRRKL